MVKHNNVVPNGHFHKDWQNRVKTWFDQPGRKKRRRLARKARAAAVWPRPAETLRPVVHCPTLKYNMKERLGRGFTKKELKEAGFTALEAGSFGVAFDHRRRDKSVEVFQANVQRLKAFKARLVVIPRGSRMKPKAGDSAPEKTANPVQSAIDIPLRAAAPVQIMELAKC